MQNRVSHIAGLRYASARRLVSPPPQKAAAPPVPAAGAFSVALAWIQRRHEAATPYCGGNVRPSAGRRRRSRSRARHDLPDVDDGSDLSSRAKRRSVGTKSRAAESRASRGYGRRHVGPALPYQPKHRSGEQDRAERFHEHKPERHGQMTYVPVSAPRWSTNFTMSRSSVAAAAGVP